MTDARGPFDDPEELSPADEEEQRSAAALARALDGGRAEPGLPDDALATAALLRLSADTARLSERRRREIREELLGSLSARAPRAVRPRWLSWLVTLLPLASAAAAYLLFVASERSEDTASAARTERVDGIEAPQAAASSARGESSSAQGAASSVLGAASAAKKAPGSPRSTLAAAPRDKSLSEDDQRALDRGASGGGFGDEARRALTQDLARDARERRQALLARADDAALTRAHAELDSAQSRPDLQRSQRTLAALAQSLGDSPDDSDGRSIRQDLYCRLAETALRLGEPRAALEWTRRGLALDGAPTPFLAQLEALEGDAWAALGDDERAAGGYMKALTVHEKLLDQDLDGR